MSQARFKIVFSGELMPDAQLDEVKANLARLFKSDNAKINSLFSGTQVALKRDLGEDEAEKYLAALQRAGAKVHKESDLGASLSLVETEDHNPPAAASATTDNRRMSCPKCGHEQDKAAECTACGIIIDKYLARQAELAASAPTTTVTSAAPDAAPATPYAPPTANVAEALPDYADLRPFSVEGRIGRLRYLAWSLSLMAAAMAVFGVVAIGLQLSEVVGAILGVLALVAMAVVSVQIGVQTPARHRLVGVAVAAQPGASGRQRVLHHHAGGSRQRRGQPFRPATAAQQHRGQSALGSVAAGAGGVWHPRRHRHSGLSGLHRARPVRPAKQLR